MKYFVTILLLFFLLFSSCEKKEKEAVIINPELLDGYWVSGYLLHNTELTRTLAAESGEKPGIQLLRLKNELNG
ncbi:MAG: hypothetical protein M3R17_10580, partial [Bacteroidota bacterium]|nr:hypothetical protein [Bacteroidota bacterium]